MKIWEDEKQVYIRASMERNTPEQNAALKERLEQIDWSILEHIQRKETVNERGVFAPLEAVEVPEIEARRDEFKAAGLDAIRAGKVGAVLLAGGQGTRLGLDRPKGTLNIGVNRELYLFEQLFRNLMDVTDEAGAYVPMYIMTSNILAIQKTMYSFSFRRWFRHVTTRGVSIWNLTQRWQCLQTEMADGLVPW